MKRTIIFWIFILTSYGQSINNFSLALGGEIANRFDQDSPNVYSGGVNFRYILPRAHRIGIGVVYSYLENLHRDSYYVFPNGSYANFHTLDRIRYFRLPLFYEYLLASDNKNALYLTLGFELKRLSGYTSQIYGSSDWIYGKNIFITSTTSGLNGYFGINFRRSLGGRWALNVFPYWRFRIIEMYYEQRINYLGLIHTPIVPYLTQDKGSVGVQVSLEHSFGTLSEVKKSNCHWELGAFAGDETGFEVIFGNKWLVEHSTAYYDMLGRQERNNVYVRYSYGFSFRHGIRRRFLIGNHLGVVPFLGLRYILLRDLYFNSQGNEYLYPLLGQKNLYMGGRMEYLIKDKYILFGEVTLATLYKIQLLGKFGVAFKTKKL